MDSKGQLPLLLCVRTVEVVAENLVFPEYTAEISPVVIA